MAYIGTIAPLYILSLYIKWSRGFKSLVFKWSGPFENQTPFQNRTDPHHLKSEHVCYLSPTVYVFCLYLILPEKLLDIVSGLGRRFDEHDVELFGFPLALLGGHLSLVTQICFISDQHYDDVTASLGSNVIYPFGSL